MENYCGSFCFGMKDKFVLRQDVDRMPGNSLAVARIQKEMGVRSTFYFRSVPESFDLGIIEEIAGMGHEIGYHYEDLVLARQKIKVKRQKNYGRGQGAWRRGGMAQSTEHSAQSHGRSDEVTPTSPSDLRRTGKGLRDNNVEPETWNLKPLFEAGIESFARNLERLRKYADVKTICMHGSPMSRWDSRLLWKYYDYREFGVKCEPYFDVDFSEILYLTDTGRRWNGGNVSVRDKGLGIRDEGLGEQYKDWVRKPIPGSLMNMTAESTAFQAKYNFRTTNDIIRAAEQDKLPDKMMMTFHPQRWTDKPMPWIKELVWQNVKNVGKYFIIKMRD